MTTLKDIEKMRLERNDGIGSTPLPRPEYIENWIQAGKPTRTIEQIDNLVHQYCSSCEHMPCFTKSACGHKDRLKLATEYCPYSKWNGEVIKFIKPTLKFITVKDRLKDTLSFLPKIPPEVTAIAGIPRSGMFTASLIAEFLHLSLYCLELPNIVHKLQDGWRHRNYKDDGYLLLVDDTVASGNAMKKIKTIDRPFIKSAIYVSEEGKSLVDLYGRILPLPHYLEWNLFNSIHSNNMAIDFDGVLCEDPPMGEQNYDKWLNSAPIKQRPTLSSIKLIVTARLERYRQHTELWLKKNKIRYDKLIMWEGGDKERWVDHAVAKRKGEVYRESSATLFVESDIRQAQVIHEVSGKRIICMSGEVFG